MADGSSADPAGDDSVPAEPGSGGYSRSAYVPSLPPAYCSFDVEMDGNNPMLNSMRSIGIALFTEKDGKIDSLYMNIMPRPETKPNPKTMRDFWERHPQQWKCVNENPLRPEAATANLASWLRYHEKSYTLKWVARPACVDWMWLKCYYETYGPAVKPDIGYYCHCLSTMLRSYFLTYPVRDKRAVMAELSNNLPYNHNALDDAVCQGTIYMNLRKIYNQTKHQFYD